jgi:hypothetical protein
MNPICHYIRWRYGNVYALKPPLGYDRRVKRPISRILFYRIRRVEDWLFQRWGGEMRKRWNEALTQSDK